MKPDKPTTWREFWQTIARMRPRPPGPGADQVAELKAWTD